MNTAGYASWRRWLSVGAMLLASAVVSTPLDAHGAVVLCRRQQRITLRVDTCKRKETRVDATELGVVGPQGPEGPVGPPGPTGAPGAPGATDVVVRTQTFGATPAGVHTVFVVMCESGERAVGGGAGFAGNAGNEELQQSYPVEADHTPPEAGDTPTGWASIIKNNTGGALVSRGYVVCARP